MEKREILRKSLHLLVLALPFLYELYGKDVTLRVVFLALLIFIFLEYFRVKRGWLFGFERLAREDEKKGVGAHIYFTLSALIIIAFFPKEIALGAILSFAFGDASAAIVGKSFGKRRILSKTLEGSLAYFIVSSLVLLFFLPTSLAVLSSFIGALAELLELPPNDNFSAPLSVALSAWLLAEVF